MEILTTALLAGMRLSQRYGATVALHETTIEVERGQILAVVGPNGCGKSTLLRALAGLAHGEGAGGFSLFSSKVPSREHRAKVMAFVPQRPDLAADFTAREVVQLGRFARGADEYAVGDALRAVGLRVRSELPMRVLSGGERQRVAVARALAQIDGADPCVLLLDEPFSGIDPGEVSRIVGALRATAERGAVVLSLHDPGLARAIATHAAVMSGGRIVSHGVASEVLVPETLTKAYGHPIDQVAGWLAPRIEPSR
ncbi:MAG: ABC transporter ATP-binding protein [Planctomycetaceae bacterium]|nr:ABC transporter ATP-binding protein [Planctomycetaceae bacterium]